MNTPQYPLTTMEAPKKKVAIPELERAIKQRLCEIFQQSGKQYGHHLDVWLEAEAERTSLLRKRVVA